MDKQSDRFDLSPGRSESEWILVIRLYGDVGAAVSDVGCYPFYLASVVLRTLKASQFSFANIDFQFRGVTNSTV